MRSFDLKLQRTLEHLQVLEEASDAWIKTEPYGITDEPDPDPLPEQLAHIGGQHRRFRLLYVDPIPDRIGLLLGDCAHNLRSALDHLAFALARKNTPALTSKQIATSEFPIFGDRAMTGKEEVAKIGCIASAPQAIIKGLQPHSRGQSFRGIPCGSSTTSTESTSIDISHCVSLFRDGDFPEMKVHISEFGLGPTPTCRTSRSSALSRERWYRTQYLLSTLLFRSIRT